ncbi:BREX-1 system adenine-specific DNA-methyltransferase PglX [Ruminococcus sp.]|uniref:BREX-1 system adenine-specific DNA-methyltransferase PglX n=1 Tax=Ruminococcus sp. TaxID=41978 RepID=UPI0025CEF0A9|nr:BREX-1 system adenine-specific DNA-methyltransferase PglX [Ruminococcus sp.]MCR4638955.1 BREX-1 system adenine-specific DNA-methyltransferase PglX [Ruminococcus sp.]
MDKNALKKYAIWARRELISRVSQKALQYGISEKNCGEANVDSVNGRVLTPNEKSQRNSLIEKINNVGYQEAMEEAAYTWFNRFTALRYMEVNGYLPSHVRVFTDESNNFKPQIIDEAIHLDIDGLDMDKVYAYKEANDTEELYKYLLITQCNAFGEILPGMFSGITDFTILLFPDNVLREGSVLEQMITLIPEEDWKDQVQIIGWLYQYYNSEKKDAVFAAMSNKVKVSKENIAAATQLFTPDWIVRYMVENSLGRLWVDGHADTSARSEWKYYLDEAEQTPEVQAQLAEIRAGRKDLTPEQIRFIDPCMGSGHILVYAFDVLMQIYLSCGYTERDAAQNIIRNNLWGLDLDKRAYQLAYFAVMMKARQYDRRFLGRGIKPNLSHFQDLPIVNYSLLDEPIKSFVEQFENADTYGSLITVQADDEIDKALDEFQGTLDLSFGHMEHLMQLYKILSQRYDVVCTNPPYMGSGNMNALLLDYLKNNYPDSKSDFFSAFIEKAFSMTKPNSFTSMITMESWMFLSSFEELRSKINHAKTIVNMVHMPYLGKGGTSLGINFGTSAFIIYNNRVADYNAQYEYTVYYETDENGVPFVFPTINERWKTAKQENFIKIPGSPIAYWVGESGIYNYVIGSTLLDFAKPKAGLATGDNDRFERSWYEVSFPNIGFGYTSTEDTKDCKYKWFPCNSGGEYRKWSFNNEIIVNWYNDGFEIKTLRNARGKLAARPQNTLFYFKTGLTWNKLSSSRFAVKFKEAGFIYDDTSRSIFLSDESKLYYLLALMCSCVTFWYMKALNPTMSFTNGDIERIPFVYSDDKELLSNIDCIVLENISISKTDWDSFETSWDFKEHPFVKWSKELWDATAIGAAMQHYYGSHPKASCPLELCYLLWQGECNDRRAKLKANEEELNRIFIEIYGLQDELTPEVDDKDITVRAADLQRDMRSFVSYAVGCMFGRYSLDTEGVAYAGGEWDESKYKSFSADKDNIIPICDNEYFDDDLTGLFVQFVKTVFGEETLEDNLRFIADALGGKGNPRAVIRNYFLNSFYADHCKTYQKRPIYWLFDSGKKNGFKALIYMHRYQPDTIARLRTDYVHEQQSRYRTAVADIEKRISGASGSEAVKLNKELEKLNAQADELITYEEMIHHLADQMIKIDLDDGVKHNYEIFKDVLAKIK